MADVQFTVFETARQTGLGDVLQEGVITIGSSSVQGAVITANGKKKRTVRVFAEANCYVTWGLDPTAVADGANGRKIGLENPEYFEIEAAHRLAIIERV